MKPQVSETVQYYPPSKDGEPGKVMAAIVIGHREADLLVLSVLTEAGGRYTTTIGQRHGESEGWELPGARTS